MAPAPEQVFCVEHARAFAEGACPGCGRFLCERCLGLTGRCARCRDREQADGARRERTLTWELLANPVVQAMALGVITAAGKAFALDTDFSGGILVAAIVELVICELLYGEGRHQATMWLGMLVQWGFAVGMVMAAEGEPLYLGALLVPVHATWTVIRLRKLRGAWSARRLAGRATPS
ncbi:MAG: hypothetical protein JST54_05870 [Deltaproteobacteria bacterium]|nr:hypothetical protein [Deltaproteobacteria bacterium]